MPLFAATEKARLKSQSPSSATAAPPRMVVVGNGPVGFAFCKQLVQLKLNCKFDVTILGAENRPAYDRIRLSEYAQHQSEDKLELASKDWYSENQLKLITGREVVQINRANKSVVTKQGDEYPYDQLVLATGSEPFVPEVPGRDLNGVFTYRTLEDIQRIIQFSKGKKRACVIGGGLLGLEAAQVLVDLGVKVEVIEFAAALMPRQLDNEAAALLKKSIESEMLQVRLSTKTSRIESDGEHFQVHFADETQLSAEVVIIAAGVRARTGLAVASDLSLGFRGGILVDDNLCTSDPSIYAIGECAAHRGEVYGLFEPGRRMANCLAKQLAGEVSRFEGCDLTTSLKLIGTPVTTLGDFQDEGVNIDQLCQSDDQVYKKIVIKRGRLAGAVCVGDSDDIPQLHDWVNRKKRIWWWQRNRFLKTGTLWVKSEESTVRDLPPTAVICTCTGATLKNLCDAEKAGHTTVETVSSYTGASTVCGSCHPLLQEFCGQQPVRKIDNRAVALVAVSFVSLILISLLAFLPPIPAVASVADPLYAAEWIWRDSFAKQISGFSVFGTILIGLLFSLRKRWSRFQKWEFSSWRLFHAVLSMLALTGVMLHTAFDRGMGINNWLVTLFLLLNTTGAVAGLFAGSEFLVSTRHSSMVRKWRSRFVRLHIWLFWPFPVLVLFHVIAVYYFGN